MAIYIETGTEPLEPEDNSVLNGIEGTEKCIYDLEYILQQRSLFSSNIHLADQKSGYIAIVHGVLITGISSLMQNNEILVIFSNKIDKWIYVFTILMLFFSFGANMLAFIPRVNRSIFKDKSWLDIADDDTDLLVRTIQTETHAARIRRTANQVKVLAVICRDKFTYIKYSIWFLSLSMASSVAIYIRLVL
jgi:hypothetical protein